MGCKVSGNLSERVFLLDFAMVNLLEYNKVIKQQHIIQESLVVVKVVFDKLLHLGNPMNGYEFQIV